MTSNLFLTNFLNPAILFFLLGFAIRAFGSNFSLSKGFSQFLSFYLVVAIGFKGGVSLINSTELGAQFFGAAFLGIGLSLFLPFFAFFFLKKTTRLDHKTQAAVAAHYGSVSLVTFVTASAFLNAEQVSYAGYCIAVLALMESPAILSGLIIASRKKGSKTRFKDVLKTIAGEIKAEGILLVLLGSFLVGLLTGDAGMAKMQGLIGAPFSGILSIFLFDMGLKVGREAKQLKLFTLPVFSFGLYMPLIGACLSLLVCKLIGFDVGTTTLMMVLGASASYIAVPAVMHVALPDAKAAVYLPLSLAVTFPFNVIVGIPLYYELAKWLI